MNESKIIEPGKAVSPFNQEELKELYDTQIDSWKVETKKKRKRIYSSYTKGQRPLLWKRLMPRISLRIRLVSGP